MKRIKPVSSGSSLHFREKSLKVTSCYNVRQSLPHEHASTRVSDQPLSPYFIRILTELPRQITSSNSTSSSLPEEPIPGTSPWMTGGGLSQAAHASADSTRREQEETCAAQAPSSCPRGPHGWESKQQCAGCSPREVLSRT